MAHAPSSLFLCSYLCHFLDILLSCFSLALDFGGRLFYKKRIDVSLQRRILLSSGGLPCSCTYGCLFSSRVGCFCGWSALAYTQCSRRRCRRRCTLLEGGGRLRFGWCSSWCCFGDVDSSDDLIIFALVDQALQLIPLEAHSMLLIAPNSTQRLKQCSSTTHG